MARKLCLTRTRARADLVYGSALRSLTIAAMLVFAAQSAQARIVIPVNYLFSGSETAGTASYFVYTMSNMRFQDSATAGSAKISNYSDCVAGQFCSITYPVPGLTQFYNFSTASSAAILNYNEGNTNFRDFSTAGNSTITNNNGTTYFFNSSTAGSAAITNNTKGTTQFSDSATAGNATITNEDGGVTSLLGSATAANATLINKAGGLIDVRFQSGPSTSIGSIDGAGTIRLGSKNLEMGGLNTTTTVSGIVQEGGVVGSLGGSIAKIGSGTLTLSGSNTYTGATVVNGGTLKAGAASVANISGAFGMNSAVTLANTAGVALDIAGFNTQIGSLTGGGAAGGNVTLGAATLTVGGDNTSPAAYAGAISGTGAMAKIGSGTLTLSGSNTYTGSTTVNGGTLAVNGTISGSVGISSGRLEGTGTVGTVVATGGTVAPGPSIGTLFVAGDYTQASTPTLEVDFNAAGQSDLVSVSGKASLAGSVVFRPAAGPYQSGTTYTFIQAASGVIGAFDAASCSDPTYLGDLVIGTIYNATNVQFTLASSALTQVNNTTVVVTSDAQLGATATPLAINGGTLAAGANLTTSRSIILGSTGGALDTSSNTMTVSGSISGTGTLTKLGTGTLILAGTNPLTGMLSIDNGTVEINGSFSGGVNIGTTGTLRGVGTVGGATTVHGRLYPGNSPGTINFTAPVTMTASSTLSLDIDGTGTGAGAGNYSRVLVSGAGNSYAANGVIQPILRDITESATNTYTPPLGQAYGVVLADGGIKGGFSSLEQPPSGLLAGTRFDALYGLNTIQLVVTPSSYASLSTLGIAETANSRSAGSALDQLRPSGNLVTNADQKLVFDALMTAAAADLPQAINQISGVTLASVASLGRDATASFNGAVLARLRSHRNAESRSGPSAQAWQQMKLASVTLGAGVSPNAPDIQRGLWGGYLYQQGNTSTDGNAIGYRTQTNGLAIGRDVPIDNDLSVGIAGGYVTSSLSMDSSYGSGSVESYRISAYGTKAINGDMQAGVWIGGGINDYKSSRNIALNGLARQATSSFSGYDISFGGEMKYAVVRKKTYEAALFGGLSYATSRHSAFNESGAEFLNLSANKTTHKSVRPYFGVSWEHWNRTGSGMEWTPVLVAQLDQELGNRIATSASQLGGIPISADSSKIGATGKTIGLGIQGREKDSLQWSFGLEVSSRNNQTGTSASANLIYRW